MHDVCVPAMTRNLAMVFEGSSCERIANRHHGIAPSNHYPTQDGEISIFCLTQAHWLELTRLMGREDLQRDPRFESPARRSLVVDEVDSMVASWSAGRRRDDLVALLAERGIPCAPVRSVEEVAFDPDTGAAIDDGSRRSAPPATGAWRAHGGGAWFGRHLRSGDSPLARRRSHLSAGGRQQ